MGKSASGLVAEAKAQIENLTPEQVAAELESGAPLVDIREADDLVANGRIPGATQAPRGTLGFYADPTSAYHRPGFDPETRMILTCAAGGRSALAVQTLRSMGYTNVAQLDGGVTGWKERVRPVEQG